MAKKHSSETLAIAGEMVIVESDTFFGGETVNLQRERAMRDPNTGELTPAAWFLSRVGQVATADDGELWSSDGMGWVNRQLTATSRGELIRLLVLTFQSEHPRVS